MGIIVAFVGPPHSGKSVFIAEIFKYLQKTNKISFFLQRAAPDGEGMWSAESDQEIVKRIRRKGKFSEEFVNFVIESIKNLADQFKLVLVDCGGRITKQNYMIISSCTHFVVVSSDRSATADWLNFCIDFCKVKCLAVFDSTLDETKTSYFDPEKRIGRLVKLERDVKLIPEHTIRVIHEFTEFLISEAKKF